MTLAIDGTNQSFLTNNGSTTLTLTTTQPNDVIVVVTAGAALTTSVTSSTGTALTFTQRAQVNNVANHWIASAFYGIATTPLNNVTLTINWSNGNQLTAAWVFGVSGANIVAPWDPNPSLPATSTTDNVTISTTSANTLMLTALTEGSSTPLMPAGGWTRVGTANTGYFSGLASLSGTAPVTNLAVNWQQGGVGAVWADAIQAAGTAVPVVPSGVSGTGTFNWGYGPTPLGNVYVQDNQNMTMNYVFDFPLTPLQIALIYQTGVLPQITGVQSFVTQVGTQALIPVALTARAKGPAVKARAATTNL